jgi:hypothetical protein
MTTFLSKVIAGIARRKSNGLIKARIEFNNWQTDNYNVTIKGIRYNLHPDCLIITKAINVYSLPNNPTHHAWSKRHYPTGFRLTKDSGDTVYKFWGRYYEGQKVRGIIVDNMFLVKED